MPTREMKLGKLPARHDPRDLEFDNYMAIRIPPIPREFGHEDLISQWGTLANDRYGDCVWAGAAHETMLWTREVGQPAAFDDDAVLSDYAAVTGFDPNNPLGTDNGTDMRDAMNYRRSTGIVDSHGNRHKIGAYVALEPGNWNHVMEALYLFGVVAIGIEFPDTAFDQFERGKPWSVRPGAQIEGGHYVPIVGRHAHHARCITWGRVQPITKRFIQTYCDEAYAPLSLEMLQGGKSLEGFDLATLSADLNQLRK